MNEENMEKLEEFTSNINMRLNILHNALKDCDWKSWTYVQLVVLLKIYIINQKKLAQFFKF